MASGKGGSDVEYSQSPEQQAVFQALLPMIQRLGGLYGGTNINPILSSTLASLPSQSTFTGQLGRNPTMADFKTLINLPNKEALAIGNAIKANNLAQTGISPTQQGITSAPTSLYNIPEPYQIPSPQIASPLAGYSFAAPQVQAGLWQPYKEAESRLLDVLQSRGQLGAPGAGISGAAGGALADFYSQAAKDIGLGTYQMSLPFTQMAQQPLSQYWAAQTGQLGDIWQTQLQREMAPWQMLPSLLGGTYPTGIAQQGGGLTSALSGGLAGAGTGLALNMALGMSNPWLLPLTLGGAGLLGGL